MSPSGGYNSIAEASRSRTGGVVLGDDLIIGFQRQRRSFKARCDDAVRGLHRERTSQYVFEEEFTAVRGKLMDSRVRPGSPRRRIESSRRINRKTNHALFSVRQQQLFDVAAGW